MCRYCSRVVYKGERFILNGDYPSGWDRAAAQLWFTYVDDLANYGAVYHERCFFKMLNLERYRKFKK